MKVQNNIHEDRIVLITNDEAENVRYLPVSTQ